MVIEKILNNHEYKLFFLKAILLGIDYGSSNNSDYYKRNIKNEIYKITENNLLSKNDNIFITKQENNILNLDYQQKYTINLIQRLSANNYGYNYSKINVLKNNLLIINKELEKNKFILKKYKETHNIVDKKENLYKQNDDLMGKRDNLYKQNDDLMENRDNLYKQTNNVIDKKDNLVNELEKTLGNLSNLIIN
jgi:hypothetical protein